MVDQIILKKISNAEEKTKEYFKKNQIKPISKLAVLLKFGQFMHDEYDGDLFRNRIIDIIENEKIIDNIIKYLEDNAN